MAAHQTPPSLGFSRQEHWSGLPFPSPMHESEKWKSSCSVVSDSSRPHGLQPTRLLFNIKKWCAHLKKDPYCIATFYQWGFLGGSDGKESPCNVADLGLIPGLKWSPGEGNTLEKSMGSQRVRQDWATELNWTVGWFTMCWLQVYSKVIRLYIDIYEYIKNIYVSINPRE